MKNATAKICSVLISESVVIMGFITEMGVNIAAKIPTTKKQSMMVVVNLTFPMFACQPNTSVTGPASRLHT